MANTGPLQWRKFCQTVKEEFCTHTALGIGILSTKLTCLCFIRTGQLSFNSCVSSPSREGDTSCLCGRVAGADSNPLKVSKHISQNVNKRRFPFTQNDSHGHSDEIETRE